MKLCQRCVLYAMSTMLFICDNSFRLICSQMKEIAYFSFFVVYQRRTAIFPEHMATEGR